MGPCAMPERFRRDAGPPDFNEQVTVNSEQVSVGRGVPPSRQSERNKNMNDTTKSKASRAADERFVARGRQAYLILPTWGVRAPYMECRVSLHGGARLPTWRVRAPYMEGRVSLHGGFDFPTWENGICGSAGRLAPPWEGRQPYRFRLRRCRPFHSATPGGCRVRRHGPRRRRRWGSRACGRCLSRGCAPSRG